MEPAEQTPSTAAPAPRAQFGRAGTYGGEWLPSNAGTFVDTPPSAPRPAIAPAPATTTPSQKRGSAPGASRRLFGVVVGTALLAGVGGAIAGTATTAALIRSGQLGALAPVLGRSQPASPPASAAAPAV